MKSVKIIQKAGSREDGNEKTILLFSLNDADVTEKYDTVFMKTSQFDAAPAYVQATRVFPFYYAGWCLLPALALQWNTAVCKTFGSVK